MENHELKTVIVGMLEENAYLLMDKKSKEIILVDPGDDPERIISAIEEMAGIPKAILITHGHHDHIGAIKELREEYPDIEYIACKDEEWLMNQDSGHWFGKAIEFTGEPTKWVSEGDELFFAGAKIQVMQTPGHTRGSVCYYLPEIKMIFTGDTLFKMSCGRTDFATGSPQDMEESLKRLSSELDDDTAVYPGHMDASDIGFEKNNNPFLRA